MVKTIAPDKVVKTVCSHCGDECPDDHPIMGGKDFCCNGCQVIYTVLQENGLGDYYTFQDTPGVSQKTIRDNKCAKS